jgi:hypothetical protein
MAPPPKPWWVVNDVTPGRHGEASFTNYVVVQSASTPDRRVAGPFDTKAEAESWQSSAVAAGANPVSAAALAAGVTNPLAFLGEIGHWFGILVSALTDVHLWISLGWLTLGLVLLGFGIVFWLKKENYLPNVVPV